MTTRFLMLGALLLGCGTSNENNTTPAPSTGPTTTSAPVNPTGVAPTTNGPVAPSPSNTGGPSTTSGSSSSSTPTTGTSTSMPTSGETQPTSGPTSSDPSDTSSSSQPTSESSEGSSSTASGPEPTPRTTCPEAPPATSKPPAADRDLAVPKSEYPDLLDRKEPFTGSRGSLPWHLYTPARAESEPNARFPLLVVLHGGYGREVEDGNILVDVAQYLLGSANGLLTAQNREAYPTYILLPHCRVSEGCSFGSNEWASTGGANFQVQAQPSVAGQTALELIDHVIETYGVDPARVYLTGNSMGGGGTWEFAVRRPELFAAVLPVSGHTPSLNLLDSVVDAKLPVWAFGAQNDYTNPYTDTVRAIETISGAGGCAWLTTYTGAAHDDDLWSSPYLESGLWPWLFAQSNSSAGL